MASAKTTVMIMTKAIAIEKTAEGNNDALRIELVVEQVTAVYSQKVARNNFCWKMEPTKNHKDHNPMDYFGTKFEAFGPHLIF